MNDYEDYLESSKPRPAGPRRIDYSNYALVCKPRPAKPARFCECGQRLSIANEGKSCFVCTRKNK